jgi:hypothetical protein
MSHNEVEQKIILAELKSTTFFTARQETCKEDSSDTACGVDRVNHCRSLSFNQQVAVLL